MASNSNISISFKIQDDGNGFKTLIANADGLKKIMTESIVEADKLKNSVFEFAAASTVIDSVNKSLQDLQNICKELTGAYALQVEAETKLAVAMRNTMGAREQDIQSIKDLCSAQQELGVIGDEVQLAGAQKMAAYLSEKKSLEQLIPVMNDMLAQQYGLNATQENAAQIASMLGKAMTGQTGALSRYGYTFNEAQENILKFGTESEKAAVLCGVISAKVGGMNAELAKTDVGKQKQLENTLGDIKEKLGSIAQIASPYVTFIASTTQAILTTAKFVSGISSVITSITKLNLVQKTAAATSALCARYVRVESIAMEAFAVSTKAGTIAATAFKWALRGVLITTGVGIAIAAVTAVIEYFVSAMDDATESTNNLLSAEQRAKRDAEQLDQLRKQETSTLENTRAALEININKLKSFNGTKAEEKKLVNEMNDAYGDTMGYFSSVADWYNALISNSKEYCRQMVAEARARMLANQIATLEQANYEITHDESGNKRKYSTKRETKEVAVQTLQGFQGSTQTVYETQEIAGSSAHEKAQENYDANKAKINSLREEMESSMEEASSIKFNVKGSENRPDADGGSHTQEKTRRQELVDLVNKAKESYITASETERQEIRKNIASWNDEIDTIDTLMAEAEHPASLSTLEDIDKEINYQRRLRQKATSENIAGIDKEIERLEEEKSAMENSGFVLSPVEEITTYKQLNRELAYLNAQLETADATRREAIQKMINERKELKKTWDAALSDLEKPADISALNSIEKLDEAISYYQQKQRAATGEEIENYQKTIDALEKKRKALDRNIEIPSMMREADEINALEGKEYKVKIRGMGFDELTSKIKELNKMLNDTENPLTDTQRKEVEGLVRVYEQWRKEAVMTFDTFREGWGSIKGMGDGVQNLTEALEGNGDAWQTVTGIVDGFLQVYDGIKKVVDIIDTINEALGVKTIMTKADASAQEEDALATAANTGASIANTAAKSGEAVAEATASGAKLPFPANIAAIAAGVAAVISALAIVGSFAKGGIVGGHSPYGDKLLARVNSGEMILNTDQQSRLFSMLTGGIKPFTNGGIISGPTVELIGEYAGASNNPEVVAPLDKLRSILNPVGAPVIVGGTLRASGRDLVCVLANETRIASKSGKRSNIKI